MRTVPETMFCDPELNSATVKSDLHAFTVTTDHPPFQSDIVSAAQNVLIKA